MTIKPKNKKGVRSSEKTTTASAAIATSSCPTDWSNSCSGVHYQERAGSSRQSPPHVTQPGHVSPISDGSRSPAGPGYNSDDEYKQHFDPSLSKQDWEKIEQQFDAELYTKMGFMIKQMVEDGACLFRAVALQVYGDQEMHAMVRQQTMDYMAKNKDYFAAYVTEDYTEYISRKRRLHVHGNHVEIHAMAELFNRNILVYQYSTDPINTFSSVQGTDNPPIRVTYHQGMHYNALVNQNEQTVNVGLSQLMSEREDIEKRMLEDKMKATDWEDAELQLHKQAEQESLMEYLNYGKGKGVKSHKSKSNSSKCSKSQSSSTTTSKPSSPASGVKRTTTTTNSMVETKKSCPNSPLHESGSMLDVTASGDVLGISWSTEADLLNQVLAISEHEYFEKLKLDKLQSNCEHQEKAGCSKELNCESK